MADPVALHAAILTRIDEVSGPPSYPRLGETLRVVVELHAPSRYWEHDPNSRLVCRGCDLDGYDAENPPWPCSTIRTIAHELGVEIGETPK